MQTCPFGKSLGPVWILHGLCNWKRGSGPEERFRGSYQPAQVEIGIRLQLHEGPLADNWWISDGSSIESAAKLGLGIFGIRLLLRTDDDLRHEFKATE